MLGYDHCWALEIRREGGVVVDRDRVRGGSERGYDMVTLVSRDFFFSFLFLYRVQFHELFYFIYFSVLIARSFLDSHWMFETPQVKNTRESAFGFS